MKDAQTKPFSPNHVKLNMELEMVRDKWEKVWE